LQCNADLLNGGKHTSCVCVGAEPPRHQPTHCRPIAQSPSPKAATSGRS
jgi:hypothetical protein